MTFGAYRSTEPAADQSGGTLYELTGVHKYFKREQTRSELSMASISPSPSESSWLCRVRPDKVSQPSSPFLGVSITRHRARVAFGGHDLTTLHGNELADLRAQAFGYAFQTFNLIPTLSAEENVETALVPLSPVVA